MKQNTLQYFFYRNISFYLLIIKYLTLNNMKKHLFKSILLLSTILTCLTFSSCAENVPGDLNQIGASKGTIEIKILTGSEKNKVIKSSGFGAVVGTKRTINDKFAVYQIIGTFQNIGFGCQVSNENGEENFEDGSLYFRSNSLTDIYTSVDDASNNVKITNIVLTDKYEQVGAQIMNGKITFKGKFIKEDFSIGGGEEMLVEGTITF